MAYINDRISGFLGYMAARVIAGQRNRKESIRIENLTATFDPLTAEAILGESGFAPGEEFFTGYPGRYENGHLIVEDQETGGGQIIEIVSDTVLFEDGKTNVALTGGWDYTGYTFSGYTNNGTGRWGNNLIVESNNDNACCIIGTVKKIDLTNCNSVSLVISVKTSTDDPENPSLRISATKELSEAVKILKPEVNSGLTLDVSDLTGEYYIAIMSYGNVLMEIPRLFLTLHNDTTGEDTTIG